MGGRQPGQLRLRDQGHNALIASRSDDTVTASSAGRGQPEINGQARLLQEFNRSRGVVGAAIAHGRAGAAKHMARIVPYNPFAFPPSLEVRCARAALAANLPERKIRRRIRGQARSYKILSKPRSVGAAIAHGRAGAAKHRARIVPYNPFAFPPSLEVRCARAAIAHGRAGAAKHRARIVPYNPFAFPPSLEVRCARAAIAHGRAGAAKHMDVRERPWPRTFQSVNHKAEFAG